MKPASFHKQVMRRMSLNERQVTRLAFDEHKHRRAGDGKFGSGGGSAKADKAAPKPDKSDGPKGSSVAETKAEKLADIRDELMGKHTDGRMKHWIENPDSSTAPEQVSVTRKDGKIVGWSGIGTIRMGRNIEHQLNVYVDPSERGQGIGQGLVKDACKAIDQDDVVYFDPYAPVLAKWIAAAGCDPEPIPKDMFD